MPSATAQVNRNTSLGGLSFSENYLPVGGSLYVTQPSITVGQPGVLTTRVSGTAGTLTMTNALHGIVTGQLIDLYWINSDGSIGAAYNLTVGTVAGTSVPFTAASGQSLPIATTAIVAGIITNELFSFIGNNLQLGVFSCALAEASLTFLASTTPVFSITIAQGGLWQWAFGRSSTVNPFAGSTITNVAVSTGSASVITATGQVGVLVT
jgi:hypothetical protein